MEYYSTIKEKEILSFATAWMDLEIIILTEINERKTNILWSHLPVYVESNEQN